MRHASHYIPAHLWRQSEQLQRMQLSLQQYMGQQTSAHCRIAHADRDQATIICDSAAWAYKIRFQQRELCKLFNTEFGLPLKRIITKNNAPQRTIWTRTTQDPDVTNPHTAWKQDRRVNEKIRQKLRQLAQSLK